MNHAIDLPPPRDWQVFEDEKLETLVIATTAPPDAKIQKLARQLTDKHAKEGRFQLPPHYRARGEDLAELKHRVLGEDGSHQGITGSGKAGVQGMGGIGKTVLAAALAQDQEISRDTRWR